MARKNKYFLILQGYYGGSGWSDLESFETNSTYSLNKGDRDELKKLKVEYAMMRYPLRVIARTEKIKNSIGKKSNLPINDDPRYIDKGRIIAAYDSKMFA